jgi:hypothetical protein
LKNEECRPWLVEKARIALYSWIRGNKPLRISRNYKTADWTKLDFSTEADWQRAVDILHDRLQTRYLEHIAVLLKRKTSGFVVLALDCALIETLQQFRLGEPETPWGQGQQYFVDFLTQTSFSQYFDGPKAALFYTTIRCGLLHQTEAKHNSRVKRGTLPLVSYSVDHKGIVINVPRFHETLAKVIGEYLAQLRKPESVAARAPFREKMNFICRIEEKPAEQKLPKL